MKQYKVTVQIDQGDYYEYIVYSSNAGSAIFIAGMIYITEERMLSVGHLIDIDIQLVPEEVASNDRDT
jgi:hypothetical protein